MDVLERNQRIDSSTIPDQILKQRNSTAVRWYVLVLPASSKGFYMGNPTKGLQREVERRSRTGEPVFEYFAPSYVEVKERNGVLVNTDRPLFMNYVFIRASENEIFRMKRFLPQYNFLTRIRDGKNEYYPYLSDSAMENLKWVAESYSNRVPLYSADPGRLMKGDKVRITEGVFKGVEASVMIQPGVGRKDIMVCVENCMFVPLLYVEPGQYEVIALNSDNRHVYTRLNGDRLPCGLHQALHGYYGKDGVTEADRALAAEAMRQYGNLEMDSDVMRSKLYSILLPALMILGDKAGYDNLLATIRTILPRIKAEQSRALLLVTLYGCTGSCIYRNQAHTIVDRWREESGPKKCKLQLIRRLDDYDAWLGDRK